MTYVPPRRPPDYNGHTNPGYGRCLQHAVVTLPSGRRTLRRCTRQMTQDPVLGAGRWAPHGGRHRVHALPRCGRPFGRGLRCTHATEHSGPCGVRLP